MSPLTRRAPLIGLSILVLVGCSSKADVPPPAPGAQGRAASPGSVITRPDPGPNLSRPDPGPATAPGADVGQALDKARPEIAELEKRATQIRPSATEQLWKDIPWMTSVVEAQKVAQAEKRPVLMWVSDDDPLDRC